MRSRLVAGITLTLLVIGMLELAFKIQPAKANGTIYIRADGSIDPPTAPIQRDGDIYTFIGNIINDSIVVERSNIIIDGNGYMIQGTGVSGYESKGVYLWYINNVTIRNANIEGWDHGVYLYLSDNNTLSGNTVTNNGYGFYLGGYYSDNNTLSGNIITNNNKGVYLVGSSSILLSGNNITNNEYGVDIEGSSGILLSGNHMTNNTWGVDIVGSNISLSGNNITNNYYYGVYLRESFSISLSGNNITNNGYCGVYLYGSSNVSLSGNNITNNGYCGVYLVGSSSILLSGNNITNNDSYGIYLGGSENNTFIRNTVTNNFCGVYISENSGNNTLSGNAVTNNSYGVYLWWSSDNNTLSGNSITNNEYGVCPRLADNNILSGNNITNNEYGVYLWLSENNILSENVMRDNSYGVYLLESFGSRIFHNNFINNTHQVYDASWDVYSETPPSINVWDDNYPSGGNYWSNYLGVDLKSGPSQDQPGSDGLGDVPYIIDDYNRDRYPLVLQPEQPPKPQLVSISPTQGGNTGMVTVRLEGIGLSEVAAVRLVREGYQQIEGLDTTVIGTTQVGTILISTRFDFTGKEPGLWDVLVTLPDSTELRLPEAFTIVSGGQPKLWVDVIGRGRIIFGKNATLGITYGNDGEIDTFDVNLVIRIPSGLKFKVNISPPNVSGVDWERVPLGSLVGSQVVISIWIYHVPAFSTGFFSLTVQAPFTSTELKIRAELWHSQPNKFTQTGDFAFANESSIFSRLVSIYPILLATNFTTLPTTDFANGLLTWLQANQNEIKLLPNAFLSVAAATEILGTPISNTALKLLIDPLASTGSPGPWYGNYCGPGPEPQDWDGDGDIDPDDYMGVNAPPFLDDLDLACKTHDWLYSRITNVKTGETGIGGFWDVWNRVGGTPQDEADWGLVEDAWDFDPSTSYLTETMGEEDGTIAATHIRDAVVISFTAMYLKPHPINLDDDVFAARVGHSFDPNDKAGPSGFGSQRFIPLGRELLYIIFFENLENATAPAEDIVITDQLDSDLDWSTLKFGEISHSQYASTNFNSTTGTITWTFTGINLPPNKNPPEGEGWVIFTIKPKPNLSSGTEIRNKATIVFDINPPMDTPEFLNTIDSQPPSSSVNSLPSQQPLSFEVGWSGTDDAGSGIRDYTIYVSDNDGPCTPWLPRVTNQSAKFTGEIGHTYAFYSIARDNAYNTEEPPTLPDTTVTMDSTPPTIRIPSRMPEGDILPDQSTKVSVNATDAVSGVKNATLSYTTDNGASWTNLSMNYNSSTGLYEATIPFQPAGTWVKYKIIAYDYAGNNATLDGTEPYCTYQVVTEFSSSLILPLFMIITLLAVIVYRRKHSM